jgi:hypothetical protein
MRWVLSGLLLVAGFAAPSARAQGVAGTWAVDFDRRVRTRAAGGQPVSRQVVERGTARLTIAVHGDSAFGRWTMEGPGGRQRTLQLRGTHAGNTVRLTSEPSPGAMTLDGRRTAVASVDTYEARVAGDTITGTTTSRFDGTELAALGPVARRFAGKRER